MANFTDLFSFGNFEVIGGGQGSGITEQKAREIAGEVIAASLQDGGQIKNHLDTKVSSDSLATVATSGSYNDLNNKPDIPVVPENVSAFNNDAGYLTEHQDISGKADKSYVDEQVATKSAVSVSSTGTATDEVKYITIDGVEKKLPEGTPTSVLGVEFTECPTSGVVGTPITIKVKITKGANEFDRLELKVNNVVKQTITEGLTDQSVQTLSFTPEVAASNYVQAIIYDTSTFATATTEITISEPTGNTVYYGVWNCDDVENPFYVDLHSVESDTKATSYNYRYTDTEYAKPVYKYPTSYGDLTSIKDSATQTEYINSFTKSPEPEIIGNINYNVYTKNEEIDCSNVTFVFA